MASLATMCGYARQAPVSVLCYRVLLRHAVKIAVGRFASGRPYTVRLRGMPMSLPTVLSDKRVSALCGRRLPLPRRSCLPTTSSRWRRHKRTRRAALTLQRCCTEVTACTQIRQIQIAFFCASVLFERETQWPSAALGGMLARASNSAGAQAALALSSVPGPT